MKLIMITFAALWLFLTACAGTDPLRIDSSSDAAFEESFAAMERSLDRKDRVRLSIAILRLRAAEFETAGEMHRATEGRPVYPIDVKDQISGMTFEQILELAEKSGVRAEVLREAT